MITKPFARQAGIDIFKIQEYVRVLKSQFAANVVRASPLPPARVKFTSRELRLEKQLGRVLVMLEDARQTLSQIEEVDPR